MKSISTYPFFGASFVALIASMPVMAQDAPVAGKPAVADIINADIIVEARRRDESVQDVPLVVNTVTAQKIEALNLRDFKDIQTVVPGLTMNSNANGIGTTSSVRGVNFDANAAGNNGTIEYYLNESPITSGALFNAMYDIGQIEVLRGPQGTLRGRAAPSGSITIAHRKPDLDVAGGTATGTLNDIHGINVNAAVGVPIIAGKLAVRVAGLIENGRGNLVRSINSDTQPLARTKSGRIFLRFEPTDFLNFETMYQRTEIRAKQFDQVACGFLLGVGTQAQCPVLIEPKDRLAIERLPVSSKSVYDIFTGKAAARFAGQQLVYVGSYTHQKVDAFDAQDNGNAYPALNLGQFASNNTKIKVHELRLQNEERVAGAFDYVAGYFNSRLTAPTYLLSQRFVGTVAAPSVFTSASLRATRTSEESFFGNLSFHLGDRTEFSAGARNIKIKQVSSLGSVTVPGASATTGVPSPGPVATDVSGIVLSGTVNNLAFGNVDRSFAKTIYSASAKHRFSDDMMVYANFGTSFRPGNNVVRATVNARASALETSFLILPSETSKSYEIGLKSQLFDKKLTLNVAAFRQDFKNYPFRSPSGVFYLDYTTATTPAPGRIQTFNFVSPVPVRVNGFELEANWQPDSSLNLTANVAYALGKIRNGQVACVDLNGDSIPDNVTSAPSAAALFAAVGTNNVSTCPVNFRSATASPWNGNIQAEYSLPVAKTSEGFARALISYNGSSLNDPANALDNYGSAARVNLYVGIRDEDGRWELTLYGKNILNNADIRSTSNGPAFSTVGATTINSPYVGLGTPTSPGLVAPQEFGITARFSFGGR